MMSGYQVSARYFVPGGAFARQVRRPPHGVDPADNSEAQGQASRRKLQGVRARSHPSGKRTQRGWLFPKSCQRAATIKAVRSLLS